MSDRNRILISILLVLGVAGAIRLYNIGWSYSSNGVDEGIMVERSLMLSKGYVPYADLPLDQAPLAFYLGALFDGSLIDLRYLTAALSMVAIGICMVAAKRIRDSSAMAITGLLMAFDFALVRESRTFSLDGISSFFLALSLLPFLQYIRTGSRVALMISGVTIGLSTASKLLGVLGLVGMLIFMLLEMRSRGRSKRRLLDLVALVLIASLPILIFMVALGPGATIEGMVMDQGHRGTDIALKMSIVGYFALNAAYVLPLAFVRRLWQLGSEARFLIVTCLAILAFMIFQPLTFFHHLALLSPPLAILAGVCVADMLAHNKGDGKTCHSRIVPRKSYGIFVGISAAVIAGLAVSAGLNIYGLAAQDEPFQYHFADIVRSNSGPNDWVVSGDPLITAIAGRLTPPDAVNVAYRISPDITEKTLESIITQYDVKVVVVCYRLNDMTDLPTFLLDNGYVKIPDDYTMHEPVLNLFEDSIGPVSVYVHSG